MRNKTIGYVLRDLPTNNTRTREAKQKFREATQIYLYGGRTYKNGKQLGTLITNATFLYVDRPSDKKPSVFRRGLTNGLRNTATYWLPGLLARRVGRRCLDDVHCGAM
jgi:hypothetical protein